MFALFERLTQPFPQQEPKLPPKSLWQFCLFYAKGHRRYLFLMGFLSGAIAVIEVSLFSFLGKLVDLLNTHTPDGLWANHGSEIYTMGAVVILLLPAIVLLHSLVLHQTLLGNLPMGIRWQAHRYLLDQSIEFYNNEFAGRVATKVMQTALAVRESLMKLLDVLLYVGVYFGGILVIVTALDIRLAIPFFIWLITYITLLAIFLPKFSVVAERQAHARSDMTGRIVDTYTNMNTVKLFSHTQRESDYARDGMQRFLHTVYPQMRLGTQLNVLVWSLNALLTFSVGALSIYLWSGDLLTAGAIAAAIGLILRLFGMSQWIMWEISALFENLGTVRDGMNTLTVPKSVTDKKDAKALPSPKGEITFDRVNFQYGGHKKIFDNFNLTIKPGEKIGLVGRSGAGKSTLVNLLLRFYDLDAGKITIDGVDISEVKQASLRSHIAMVTQDTSLLHRSVRENLLYGRPDATEEEMQRAAELAHADTFINELYDNNGGRGYDTLVGERGVKLSGGQRQRIAIARVLLKDAPILILDEATSALDSEVETVIQENLYQLMENKTVVAIAHRLSTIAEMDRLVVLDNGRVIEEGSHQALLEHNGVYASLWKRQSGGFLAED